jgi:hypothetical protein
MIERRVALDCCVSAGFECVASALQIRRTDAIVALTVQDEHRDAKCRSGLSRRLHTAKRLSGRVSRAPAILRRSCDEVMPHRRGGRFAHLELVADLNEPRQSKCGD